MNDNTVWTIQNCIQGNDALNIIDPDQMKMETIDFLDVRFSLQQELGKQMGQELMRRANDQSSLNFETTNGLFSRVNRYYDGKILSMPLLGNIISCQSVLRLQGHVYACFKILRSNFIEPFYTAYIDTACFTNEKNAAMKFITTYCDVKDERCYKSNAQSAFLGVIHEALNQSAEVLNKTGWIRDGQGIKYIRKLSLTYDVAGYDTVIYDVPQIKSGQLDISIRRIEKYVADHKCSEAEIGFLILFSFKALVNTLIGVNSIRQDTVVLYGDTDVTASIAKSILKFVRRQGTDDNLSLYDYDASALEKYIHVTYDDVVVLDGNGYKYFSKKQRDLLERLASGRRIGQSNIVSPLAILMNSVSKDLDINVPLVDCYDVKDSETIADDVVVVKNHIIEAVENGINPFDNVNMNDDIYLYLAGWITETLGISNSDFSRTLLKGALYMKHSSTPCLKIVTQVFQHRIAYLIRSKFLETIDLQCCSESEVNYKFLEKDNKICMSSSLISKSLSLCNLDERGSALFIEKDLYKNRLLTIYEGSDYRTDVWIPNIGKKISVLAVKRDFFFLDTNN